MVFFKRHTEFGPAGVETGICPQKEYADEQNGPGDLPGLSTRTKLRRRNPQIFLPFLLFSGSHGHAAILRFLPLLCKQLLPKSHSPAHFHHGLLWPMTLSEKKACSVGPQWVYIFNRGNATKLLLD